MWKYIQSVIVKFIDSVRWKSNRVLTPTEVEQIRQHLIPNYYIILTNRRGYLATYAIAIVHLLLTGKWGFYSHSLMNTEDEVNGNSDFRLIEATTKGVHYTPFLNVFDESCSSVALIKPTKMSVDHWTAVLDRAKAQLGKPYDSLYDLASTKEMSCVELVRYALQSEPNYDTNFADFERLIHKHKYLTPHMFYTCKDFEIVYEVRH